MAYFLSRNFATMEEVSNILTDTTFIDGFEAAEAFLNDYCVSLKTASYTLLKETAMLKDSKCYNWLYLTLQDVFESVLLEDKDPDNPFADIIHSLSKHKEEIENGLAIIQEVLSHRYLNYNPTLSVARFLSALNERKQI